MYKKLLTATLALSLIIPSNIVAQATNANHDSGTHRLMQIMTNDQTGIAAYNKKNINYAQTLNLAHDLNVAQIADFFECKTCIGRSFIEETLKCPVNPKDKDSILAHRQNAIKLLVENPVLKKEVDQLLASAHEHEQEVVTLMSDLFIGRTCPELEQLETLKKQNPNLYLFCRFLNINTPARSIATGINVYTAIFFPAMTALFAKSAYHLAQAGQNFSLPAFGATYTGLFSAISAYAVYKDYETALKKRSKMHALNQLIHIAENIETLSHHYGIQNQFKISSTHDSDGLELINGLKKSRYGNKKSYLFLTPLVHTFLYKVYEQQSHLTDVFSSIAEMDAYNAIATKIIESQNCKNKFCFVTFIENEKSMLDMSEFWNVLVKNPVVNDFSENKNIILTGPNAGGKTTAIRALLQNVLLGQSFGIAAASRCQMTMFDVIFSYLNISDDLVNGLSLFASEVKRAQEILQKIKSLEPHQKFFFALDELFTGTAAQDGEVCAYNFIKKILTFEGIQFIYATHFSKLKELGNDCESCINYKVDAPTKNAENRLVYPFTLSHGANESYVALDMAREANLFA